MVVKFNVFGRPVGAHYLAIATLATTFGAAYLSMGSSDKTKTVTPPINAKSEDEEKFIKEFLAQAEEGAKDKAKH